eukprot:CAMPEP_0170597782 /NCGR_PEP_ID=MMETSP0224-20130122/15889_1 /TAXON_ID=285029 /ORGANISM="Togula jolla, Strain CCCM 725" /LENGTH=51 /DNA_ID=CAMNT_0010922273 /DNA_START=361 /DNA_END=516 /DNA_ORIENTATION=+
MKDVMMHCRAFLDILLRPLTWKKLSLKGSKKTAAAKAHDMARNSMKRQKYL